MNKKGTKLLKDYEDAVNNCEEKSNIYVDIREKILIAEQRRMPVPDCDKDFFNVRDDFADADYDARELFVKCEKFYDESKDVDFSESLWIISEKHDTVSFNRRG